MTRKNGVCFNIFICFSQIAGVGNGKIGEILLIVKNKKRLLDKDAWIRYNSIECESMSRRFLR